MTNQYEEAPEATIEDYSKARLWMSIQEQDPEKRDRLRELRGITSDDRVFKNGLRFSHFKTHAAQEVQDMTLEEFAMTWDAVLAAHWFGHEITADVKTAYLDSQSGLRHFTEQTYKAFHRMRNRAIGSLEVLAAVRSCRKGLAVALVHEKIPRVSEGEESTHTEEAYPPEESPIRYTDKGREILKKAHSVAEQSGESLVCNEHLLLALLEVKKTNCEDHLRRNRVGKSFLRKRLQQFLGIGEPYALSPRLRAYQLCSLIECDLKDAVVRCLEVQFGEQWWTEGVPVSIRKSCAVTREEEDCSLPSDAYCYLVHFKEIVKANWPLFGPAMEQASGHQGKDRATHWMSELNPVRNAVMHPSKRDITSEDLDALAEARKITSTFVARLDIHSP